MDVASVNWHEDGTVELAEDLIERGIGVEAGLWTRDIVPKDSPRAVGAGRRSSRPQNCRNVW